MESSTNDLLHEGSIKELAAHAAHFLMVVWIPKGMVNNSGTCLGIIGHLEVSGNQGRVSSPRYVAKNSLLLYSEIALINESQTIWNASNQGLGWIFGEALSLNTHPLGVFFCLWDVGRMTRVDLHWPKSWGFSTLITWRQWRLLKSIENEVNWARQFNDFFEVAMSFSGRVSFKWGTFHHIHTMTQLNHQCHWLPHWAARNFGNSSASWMLSW